MSDEQEKANRERIHQIELDVLNLSIQSINQTKLVESNKTQIEKVGEKTDKVATRLTVIAAFLTGALFVSSEPGGNILRAVVGLLL